MITATNPNSGYYKTGTGISPTASNNHGLKLLGNGFIALAVFLGGFVIYEPAPYDLLVPLMLVIWLIGGIRLPREAAILLFFFTMFNFGGIISSFMMKDYPRGLNYVAVSYFLALSSVFFATLIYEDMARLRIIFRAYVLGAVCTSILGIIGYFGVGGFEIFTRYSRAMGAFQDPNVYGPFLVVPILYLIYGIVNRSLTLLPVRVGMLIILLLGLFLAFSRAAWGLSVLAGLLFYLLLVINEQQAKVRLKYIVLAAVGLASIVLLLVIALQFDAVSSLFTERAKAVQNYDGGRIGRFARHLIGYELALSKPFGIGPLEFGYIYLEDTHNNFVKALMAYGWIGFVSWVTIMIWTIIAPFKLLFRQRPWLPYLQIAYVVYLGHFMIGNVIDTDHWRHFYLVLGIIWGCTALEAQWQRHHAGISTSPEDRSKMNAGNSRQNSKKPNSLLENL